MAILQYIYAKIFHAEHRLIPQILCGNSFKHLIHDISLAEKITIDLFILPDLSLL
jgi:hypothetical protein